MKNTTMRLTVVLEGDYLNADDMEAQMDEAMEMLHAHCASEQDDADGFCERAGVEKIQLLCVVDEVREVLDTDLEKRTDEALAALREARRAGDDERAAAVKRMLVDLLGRL